MPIFLRVCSFSLMCWLLPGTGVDALGMDEAISSNRYDGTEQDSFLSDNRPDVDKAFSAAIHMGLYRPQLSRNPEAERLFEKIFTNDRNDYFSGRAPIFTLEGAWYPFAHLTKLGVLLQLQYWSLSGKALVCKDSANEFISCSRDNLSNVQSGEDTTSINLLPIAVGLVYRADMLQRANLLPLFATAKATINNGFWWSTVGPYQGIRSAHKILGHTLYYAFAVGIGYALPTPKVGSSQSMQTSITLEATYVLGNAPHQKDNLDWTDKAQVYGVLGLLFDI